MQLPTSLYLQALKSLHLVHPFPAANDNGSNRHMLSTLVLEHCNLHLNASFLSIYNFNISTPNLNSITLLRDLIHQVSVCDLYFLEQVNFDVDADFHIQA